MDFHRIFDILAYQQAKYPQEMALASCGKAKGEHFSTKNCLEKVDQLSIGLLKTGLKKGDAAAIITHSGSPIWNLVDFALQQIGVVVVPIHATAVAADVAYILKDASVKTCFASNQALFEKISRAAEGGVEVFVFEKLPGCRHWEELLAEPSSEEISTLENGKNSITEADLATIIYTSGTTGAPKGVMLSHKNIVSNIKAVLALLPVHYKMEALSFLPLSHIFERVVTYLYMAAGMRVWYSEDINLIFNDLSTTKPHFFTAVPRILEKMYDRAMATRNTKGFFGKKIFDAALAWGEDFDPLEKLSPVYWLRHQFFDFMVYRQLRKALGGRVEGILVGAAALQPRLAKLFSAAGLPTREGYGLTETSPVVAFNHFEPGLYRFGTVGLPIPGTEVKIDAPNERGEGEILVKGPNVTSGYHNLPDETAAAFTADGWLRTGDVGRFTERRFLQITDRKRDIFKTSSGKFVAPQRVENQLKTSPFIRQCLVVGHNRPHASALIVPDFDLLENWSREQNVHWTAPQFMALNPKVLKFMESILAQLNEGLEPHERVRKFALLPDEWTAEKGELTFTMKLARDVLKKKFEKEIEGMYKIRKDEKSEEDGLDVG